MPRSGYRRAARQLRSAVQVRRYAAARGIEVEAVESSYKGDMDIRGLFGMSDEVRKGFSNVAVNIRVKSEANVEDFTEMALFSPVYDIVSNSLPVEFMLTKT